VRRCVPLSQPPFDDRRRVHEELVEAEPLDGATLAAVLDERAPAVRRLRVERQILAVADRDLRALAFDFGEAVALLDAEGSRFVARGDDEHLLPHAHGLAAQRRRPQHLALGVEAVAVQGDDDARRCHCAKSWS
jgi:hypothetical protein